MQSMQHDVISPATNWWSIKMTYISVSNYHSAKVTCNCARSDQPHGDIKTARSWVRSQSYGTAQRTDLGRCTGTRPQAALEGHQAVIQRTLFCCQLSTAQKLFFKEYSHYTRASASDRKLYSYRWRVQNTSVTIGLPSEEVPYQGNKTNTCFYEDVRHCCSHIRSLWASAR